MITIKINCSRINKEHLYQGKNGKYLDLVLFENRNGPDQYGNTHMVVQSLSKEARERGEKGPILGNARIMDGRSAQKPTTKPPQNPDDEPVPF